MNIYTLNAGDGGLAGDIDGKDAAENLWTIGKNVRFENGYFMPFDGHSRMYDPPSVVPYGVFSLRTAGANAWVYPGLAKIYTVSSAGTHTDITRATGGDYTATADTKWTGGELSGLLVLNNENDVPQYWNGNTATDCAALTGWTSTWRTKALRPLRNYLVAVNITKTSTNYPVMVKWSHAADPGAIPTSWDEADATKDAGEQDLADAAGALVDLVPLGDLGILYTTGSYHAMQWIGGTYVWRFTRLSEFAGILSQNCAVAYPGGHVVLTSGDVITHNGGAPQTIINARMRKTLFDNLSSTYFARSFVAHNELKSEVWVCIPSINSTGTCDTAYIWNYAQNSWSVRDLPSVTAGGMGPVAITSTDTWADGAETWDQGTTNWDPTATTGFRRRLVLASSTTHLYLMDDSLLYDDAASTMTLERGGLAMGDHNRIKLVKSIRPQIDGVAGTLVGIRLGTADVPDGPYTWTGINQFVIGTSRAVYPRAAGKYIAVKFEDETGAQWRCRSLDLEYEVAGER